MGTSIEAGLLVTDSDLIAAALACRACEGRSQRKKEAWPFDLGFPPSHPLPRGQSECHRFFSGDLFVFQSAVSPIARDPQTIAKAILPIVSAHDSYNDRDSNPRLLGSMSFITLCR